MVRLCMDFIDGYTDIAEKLIFIDSLKTACDKKIYLEVTPNHNKKIG